MGRRRCLAKEPDGTPVFQPGVFACGAVALGLGGFAYTCLAHVTLLPPLFLVGRTKMILLVIRGCFALRTIGDFKYAGMFRRIQSTDFSRKDRVFYTPLCFALSAFLAWLAVGK